MLFAIRLLEEGGQETGGIGWMVWVVLAIFFVMVFLGWLASSKGWLKKEEEPAHGGHDSHGHDAHEADHGHAQAHAPAAAPAKPDDLKELEGIGPKVAKLLNGMGIHTFADLAAADVAKVQEALNAAGMQYMDPSGWIEQASFAAKGDKEGLAKLQAELKGGRR